MLAGLVGSACVYDPDDRCGEHQVLIESDRCACEPGFVPGDRGCVPCAENEDELNGACVCVAGFARPAEGAACEPIPDSLGDACDTATDPCPEGPFELCHATDGTAGYCTGECAAQEDCVGGYRCQEGEGAGYCRRPPLGLGEKCENDDDCAGGEATYCELLQTKTCVVPCSAGNTGACFVGEVCCDFAVFEPICVPAAACASFGSEVQ